MQIRILLILLYCINFQNQAFAENYIDSLETRLILVDNDEKLLILDEIIPYYFRNEPLQASKKAQKLLSLARQENNTEYEIKAQRYIGLSNSHLTSDHEKALNECKLAELNAKSNGFVEELILTNLAFADIYHQIGDITKSLEFQIKASYLADSMGINHLISLTLNNQARSFIELDDIDKAEQCLKRSLKLAKIHDLSNTSAETHLIFGEMYEKSFNHNLSLQHYRKALNIYKALGKDIQVAIALYKIGDCYQSMDILDTAFQYQLNALSIRNQINDRTGLAESYNKIGQILIERGENQRAINNLKLGLNNAELVNSNKLMQQSFDYLYQAYLAAKNYKKALIYQNKFSGISELIYAEASKRRIEELNNKNEIEKRGQEINTLEQIRKENMRKLATNRKSIISLVLFLLVTIALSIIIIKSYGDKKRLNDELQKINDQVLEQNEKLTELNGTKDKFFSSIGHDLKGPLNSLSSFSHLLINHTASLSEEEIRTLARELDNSLKNLFELLDNLLGWARSQTGQIEIKPENFPITGLIKENVQLLSKAAINKKIEIEILTDEEIMVFADKNSVRTIIRNLLSNAIKFTNREGIISFSVDVWQKEVEIGIRDSGVGMTDDDQKKIFNISTKHSTIGTNREKGTGLGLILCKEFAEKNHGGISVVSEVGVGTTFKITLPKSSVHYMKHAEEISI